MPGTAVPEGGICGPVACLVGRDEWLERMLICAGEKKGVTGGRRRGTPASPGCSLGGGDVRRHLDGTQLATH